MRAEHSGRVDGVFIKDSPLEPIAGVSETPVQTFLNAPCALVYLKPYDETTFPSGKSSLQTKVSRTQPGQQLAQ